MKRLFALLVLLSAVLPVSLRAFYSFSEVKAERLRANPDIKIRAHQNGPQINFTVAFLRGGNSNQYWVTYLQLKTEKESEVASIQVRGEDGRRAIMEDSVGRLKDWQKFRSQPADVFSFSVAQSLVPYSTFSWELGPTRDEHGLPWGGGVVTWCSLQTLIDATVPQTKTETRNDSPRP